MSSLNNTALPLRTRGPLPGLGLFDNPQNGIQQAAPTPEPAGAAPEVNSRGTKRPASPMERPATPEPVNIAELERSPSPFIKKEPADKYTYSSCPVPDDEDEYDRGVARFSTEGGQNIAKAEEEHDPAGPLHAIDPYQTPATTKYDPAQPSLRRSIRSDRILNHVDGQMVEPPTICFTDPYRNKQLTHVLRCHGEVGTMKPQPCGDNCALAVGGAKSANGWPVVCTHPVCVSKRNKRHASVFAPRKKARTATPAAVQCHQASTALPLDGFGTVNYVPARPARAAGISKADLEIMELNKKIQADPALAKLVHDPRNRGPGVRPLSKRHLGYATLTERQEELAFNNLFKNAGALDLGNDFDAIDSADKNLSKQGQERSGLKIRLRRRKAADSESFQKHEHPVGAKLEKGRPWHYANHESGEQSIRNAEGDFFSMPKPGYDAMVEQEGGVMIDREDTRAHRLPRNANDLGEEEGGLRDVIEDEVCAVCGEDGERVLDECIHCRNRFHRTCVNKPDYDSNEGGHGYLYAGPWRCDGEGCDRELSGPRWVCGHVACFHYDYCGSCAREKMQPHFDDVLAAGGNPLGHSWAEVEGQLGPALKALEEAEEGGFICSDCTEGQKKKAQDLAQRMFGKQHTSVTDLRTEGTRRKMVRSERMKELSFVEGMEERIRDNPKRRRPSSKTGSSCKGSKSGETSQSNRNSSFSKTSLSSGTPQRRSSRLVTSTGGTTKPACPLQPIAETAEDVQMGDAED